MDYNSSSSNCLGALFVINRSNLRDTGKCAGWGWAEWARFWWVIRCKSPSWSLCCCTVKNFFYIKFSSSSRAQSVVGKKPWGCQYSKLVIFLIKKKRKLPSILLLLRCILLISKFWICSSSRTGKINQTARNTVPMIRMDLGICVWISRRWVRLSGRG